MARVSVAALVVIATATGCALGDNTDGSYRPLTEAVQAAASGEPLRLSEVTDFDWGVAHVIPPYASDEEIERTLGVDWKPTGTSIDATEGTCSSSWTEIA